MKIEIEGLPELPEGYVGVRWGRPKKGDWYFHRGRWWEAMFHFENDEHLIAIPAPPPEPWYPPSWRDADGKLLPDVYEHDGGWPKCTPLDRVQYLFAHERSGRYYTPYTREAGGIRFGPRSLVYKIVAYRVVERVKG